MIETYFSISDEERNIVFNQLWDQSVPFSKLEYDMILSICTNTPPYAFSVVNANKSLFGVYQSDLSFDSINGDRRISVTKTIDEWFYLDYRYFSHESYYPKLASHSYDFGCYKCDQMDGFINFIKEKILI